MEALLEAANWAPTHGKTEPWRFVVMGRAAQERFMDLTLKARMPLHFMLLLFQRIYQTTAATQSSTQSLHAIHWPSFLAHVLIHACFWTKAHKLCWRCL